jgi:hypothetical protein
VANLFYRNTNSKISFEVLDSNNNYIGLSSSAVIYWYIKTPDNFIISNDTNIAAYSFANGNGIYTSIPVVQEEMPGFYYINYVLTKIGEYKYKFQVTDSPTLTNVAISGDIKVIGDGIF